MLVKTRFEMTLGSWITRRKACKDGCKKLSSPIALCSTDRLCSSSMIDCATSRQSRGTCSLLMKKQLRSRNWFRWTILKLDSRKKPWTDSWRQDFPWPVFALKSPKRRHNILKPFLTVGSNDRGNEWLAISQRGSTEMSYKSLLCQSRKPSLTRS